MEAGGNNASRACAAVQSLPPHSCHKYRYIYRSCIIEPGQLPTWQMASVSLMLARNLLPSPSPLEAPRTSPAMSTNSTVVGSCGEGVNKHAGWSGVWGVKRRAGGPGGGRVAGCEDGLCGGESEQLSMDCVCCPRQGASTLLPKASCLKCAASTHDFPAAADFGQLLQPRVWDSHNAHVRLDCAEGEVGCLCLAVLDDGVEEGGLQVGRVGWPGRPGRVGMVGRVGRVGTGKENYRKGGRGRDRDHG